MTRERWDRIQALLLDALDVPASRRTAFLVDACGGDTDLRLQVESLLEAHATPGALDRLAGALGTGALRELLEGPQDLSGNMGPYELRERLGRGGMGVVFHAWDPKLERDVALKLLPALLNSNEASRERLLVEAQIAAGLEHPNICTIYGIGETKDGRLYIGMPYYEGETLEAKLASGPLSENDSLALALQVARGLTAAHGRGVIHRDIKPGNLMITAEGTLKILDFGIAQLDGASDPVASTPGTAHYMSPEQVAGGQVDARTDLWSLGVVLYEMLAGHRPLERETAEEVRHAILHDDPIPLEAVRPEVGSGTHALVRSLLQKDPRRRPTAAAGVVRELGRLRRAGNGDHGVQGPSGPGDDSTAPPGLAAAGGRRRVGRVAGLLALGSALLVAGSWYTRGAHGASASGARARSTSGGVPSEDASSTASSGSYEYYRRGKALLAGPPTAGRAVQSRSLAEGMFRQAVRLDSTFAPAWASLANLYTTAVSGERAWAMAIHRPVAGIGQGRATADSALRKAVAYGPDLPETRAAQGWWAFNVERDRSTALEHFEAAFRARPRDPELASAIGLIRISQGQWEEGLSSLKRALRLDPESYWRAGLVGDVNAHLRRYDEAERMYDRALLLAPTFSEAYVGKAIVHLKRDGDVRGAAEILESALPLVDMDVLIHSFALLYARHGFVRILHDYFEAALSDTTVALNVRGRCSACYWSIRAEAAEIRGDADIALAYHDSAFSRLLPGLERREEWYRPYRFVAVHAAGLGRFAEARRYAESAVRVSLPLAAEAVSSYHELEGLAEVQARTGDVAGAVATLDQLLSHPGLLSVPVLELDPLWEPLRSDPQFLALLERHR